MIGDINYQYGFLESLVTEALHHHMPPKLFPNTNAILFAFSQRTRFYEIVLGGSIDYDADGPPQRLQEAQASVLSVPLTISSRDKIRRRTYSIHKKEVKALPSRNDGTSAKVLNPL